MGQVEESASFVVRSPNRTMVLQRLAEGAAIPSQIREDTGQEYSRISEALNALRERDLVELVVDEDTKRGRLYAVSDHGKEVLQFMDENGMLDDSNQYGRR
ncbi:winged helix-turn-helix domain-containing protein [Halobacterium sp. R2-5]|uniref:winged helix-turn-helix domain-containing protein n=1 Tax=Halobacterium sp. R2-5 TaxID=2715751 RepID=UPI00142031A1|nr:winged helix-turn-helix domain-containing protein [Halobacterium sp. R2-5]NIB98038.1 winged helix-turn-helix transcriptional regulator [Halobacterium sp. R2-5]